MNTMKSHKETGSFERSLTALQHRCPACGTVHEVSAARAQFAYGRQLACSPDCEAVRRRGSRASYRLRLAPACDSAFAKPDAGHPSLAGVAPMSPKLATVACEPYSVGLKIAGDASPVGLCTKMVEGRDDRSCCQRTRRFVGSSEQKAVLSVTVDAVDTLRVRRAIFQAGGQSLAILKAVPVAHSSKVRLFVGMRADALELVRSAVMRSVTAGEFGRVTRM